MPINNEIQHKAALERYKYLDSLEFDFLSKSENLEFIRIASNIFRYEELHYPIEGTDATRSDT